MNARLHEIDNWLERAQSARWSASALAKKCGVSLRTLERHFAEEFSKTAKRWFCEERMKKAKELKDRGWKINEISVSLGYRHPQHFSRAYKKYHGHCPTQMAQPSWHAVSEIPAMQILPNIQATDSMAASANRL